MIVITLNNIKNLNTSLQVGDMVYATSTTQQVSGVTDFENQATGVTKLGGILRRITIEGSTVTLEVDDSFFANVPQNAYIPLANDFLMVSKYNQMDGDVNGYYAEATFKNNSKIKAELFSVGSEITINSK